MCADERGNSTVRRPPAVSGLVKTKTPRPSASLRYSPQTFSAEPFPESIAICPSRGFAKTLIASNDDTSSISRRACVAAFQVTTPTTTKRVIVAKTPINLKPRPGNGARISERTEEGSGRRPQHHL